MPITSCTLIGCDDGLSVQFSRPPVGAFRVEATVLNDPVVAAIDCADAATCMVRFPDLVAEHVTLRLITSEGTVTQQFQPRYEDVRPNGPRCGPACRQATVTLQLPV